MTDLKKGDRVTVSVPPRKKFNGVIVGEGRHGLWWNVVKDGTKFSNSFHKSFCRPEIAAGHTGPVGSPLTPED